MPPWVYQDARLDPLFRSHIFPEKGIMAECSSSLSQTNVSRWIADGVSKLPGLKNADTALQSTQPSIVAAILS